jgi:hypothetical protein
MVSPPPEKADLLIFVLIALGVSLTKMLLVGTLALILPLSPCASLSSHSGSIQGFMHLTQSIGSTSQLMLATSMLLSGHRRHAACFRHTAMCQGDQWAAFAFVHTSTHGVTQQSDHC